MFDWLWIYPWVNPIGLTVVALIILWIRLFNPSDILGWRRASLNYYAQELKRLYEISATDKADPEALERALTEAHARYSLWKWLCDRGNPIGLFELNQYPILPDDVIAELQKVQSESRHFPLVYEILHLGFVSGE